MQWAIRNLALVDPSGLADKRTMMRLCLIFATLFACFAPMVRADRAVTVFAAASMGGVLEEIAESYPTPVAFAYGGSGAMARQIAAGAPADLVVLANPVWMTWLMDQGAVPLASAQIVAHNQLVLIGSVDGVPIDDISTLPQRLGAGRLAIGQRDAVPAGAYAQQWLRAEGLWDVVAPHLAETDNVRAALALVARGDVPFGVVYASDALAEKAVDVLYPVPPALHDPIAYPAASLTPAGADFLAHLLRPAATEIFIKYGFEGPS